MEVPDIARLLRAAMLAVGSICLGSSIVRAVPASPATYYIDYENGDDRNNGRSPAAAWKHAPGDPAAAEAPRGVRLAAGDTLLFAPGVRYRGTVKMQATGSPGAPITIASIPGRAPAIFDGSDPVAAVRRCTNAGECGGYANWRSLSLVEFRGPVPENAALFTEAGLLRIAQSPDPSNILYSDEASEFWEADGIALSRGSAELPEEVAAGLAAPGSRQIALWVQPNRVVTRPILALEGRLAAFDPSQLQMYSDRPAKIAVRGHASLIDRTGEYAILPGGKFALAMLPANAASVSVATGRTGIELVGSSHVTIRGLGFENFADDGASHRAGIAISLYTLPGRGFTIEGNRFRNFFMPMGQGPINLHRASDVIIRRNRIENIALGSGMRVSGPASGISIQNNRISGIGRTGIMLMGVEDALVAQNHLADIKGVHSNGMSAYLANRNVRFIANTVLDARHPVTFHGNNEKLPAADGILFANNLLVASRDGYGALLSWGKNNRNVVIRNNVLLGATGLLLTSKDHGVTVADNIVSGLTVSGAWQEGWRFAGNEYVTLGWQQQKGYFEPRLSPAVKRAVEASGDMSRPAPALCVVIRRNSLSLPGRPGFPVGAIGADARCP